MREPDLSISFSLEDPENMETVRGRVTDLMRRLHRLPKGAPDDFAVESAESLRKSFRDITTTITLVVSGVVGISLLVGGIGIMNIMLVSVSERTREIGIAKALGAPRSFILMQFLVEAILLALMGGIAGVVVGYALAVGIGALIPGFPLPSVPVWVAFAACGFSGLVGIVFGILPASNAANLTPIDALRHE